MQPKDGGGVGVGTFKWKTKSITQVLNMCLCRIDINLLLPLPCWAVWHMTKSLHTLHKEWRVLEVLGDTVSGGTPQCGRPWCCGDRSVETFFGMNLHCSIYVFIKCISKKTVSKFAVESADPVFREHMFPWCPVDATTGSRRGTLKDTNSPVLFENI